MCIGYTQVIVKYYTILYEGLKHLQISVFWWALGPISHEY
jgi:hypothetical protein